MNVQRKLALLNEAFGLGREALSRGEWKKRDRKFGDRRRWCQPTQSNTGCTCSPELFYEERLRRIVRPGDRLLDAGCGLGKFFSWDFAREIGCQITGVDIQQDLGSNRNLDVRVRGNVSNLPFVSQTFDVVNCRLVVEHLAVPEGAFGEFHRVLKPGGRLAILTPNLLHYFGAAARLTPHWFHLWFNSRVRGFEHCDVFPTYYRANTKTRLYSDLLDAGFRQVEMSLVEGPPTVLAFNSLAHYLGGVFGYLVTQFDFLSRFRLNIVAVAYKR
jgi:ubiquinone/menaquinone biosynthesis C-methylase UbiE